MPQEVDKQQVERGARFKKIRDHFGKSQEDFGVMLGETNKPINKATISKYELGQLPISKKAEVELFTTYKVNKEWLDTGNGEMFSASVSSKQTVVSFAKNPNLRLKPEDFAEAFPDWEGVPVYNTEVTASFVEKYTEEDGRWEPLYYLRDPQFRDCNFAARIAGDSMHSEIRHGDYIICQEVTDKSIIVFGEIYYVVTTNGLQTCKYINAFPVYDPNYKGKTQLYDYDRVLLVPKNDSISPTPLHKNDILRLYKVRGIVRGY